MKLALLLIALGFGYRVYADASREKGTLRSLGQWVGALMMATSLAVSAFTIYACSSYYQSGKGFFGCPFMHPRPTVSESK